MEQFVLEVSREIYTTATEHFTAPPDNLGQLFDEMPFNDILYKSFYEEYLKNVKKAVKVRNR
jgi:hypothetical protein